MRTRLALATLALALALPASAAGCPLAQMTFDKTTAYAPGEVATVTGTRYDDPEPSSSVTLLWRSKNGSRHEPLATVAVSDGKTWKTTITIPDWARPGDTLQADAYVADGGLNGLSNYAVPPGFLEAAAGASSAPAAAPGKAAPLSAKRAIGESASKSRSGGSSARRPTQGSRGRTNQRPGSAAPATSSSRRLPARSDTGARAASPSRRTARASTAPGAALGAGTASRATSSAGVMSRGQRAAQRPSSASRRMPLALALVLLAVAAGVALLAYRRRRVEPLEIAAPRPASPVVVPELDVFEIELQAMIAGATQESEPPPQESDRALEEQRTPVGVG